jgi:hypothetical protein
MDQAPWLVSRPMRRDSEDGPPSSMLMSIEDRVGDRGNRGSWLQTARRQGSTAAVRPTEAAAWVRGKTGA